MDPSYETLVDPFDFLFTMGAYGVHGAFAGLQALLAVVLLVSGARSLTGAASRASAALRIAAGVALVLPLAGVPFVASLAGGALALPLFARGETGWRRRLAVASVSILLLFSLWEREDPLALGLELFSRMQTLRTAEVDWQLAADREAPKVGSPRRTSPSRIRVAAPACGSRTSTASAPSR